MYYSPPPITIDQDFSLENPRIYTGKAIKLHNVLRLVKGQKVGFVEILPNGEFHISKRGITCICSNVKDAEKTIKIAFYGYDTFSFDLFWSSIEK